MSIEQPEQPAFHIKPDDSGEQHAFDVLSNDPSLMAAFFESLEHIGNDFTVTLRHGNQVYKFSDGGPGAVRRLALRYAFFDPAELQRQEEAKRQAEAEKAKAERAARERHEQFKRSLLGGSAS